MSRPSCFLLTDFAVVQRAVRWRCVCLSGRGGRTGDADIASDVTRRSEARGGVFFNAARRRRAPAVGSGRPRPPRKSRALRASRAICMRFSEPFNDSTPGSLFYSDEGRRLRIRDLQVWYFRGFWEGIEEIKVHAEKLNMIRQNSQVKEGKGTVCNMCVYIRWCSKLHNGQQKRMGEQQQMVNGQTEMKRFE